jgi:hypothetical protein
VLTENFDAVATAPPLNGYVFPSPENIVAAVNVLAGNIHSLTLSDFSATGVNIANGANDIVATVLFRTSASFDGVLSLSLNEDTFQLDTPDVNPTSVPEYESARSEVASNVDISLPAVPEPGTITLAMLAGVCCLGRFGEKNGALG